MKKRLASLLALLLTLGLFASPAAALEVEDARDLLQKYYVDEIPEEILSLESLDQILAALNDPYTVYLSAEEYQSFLSSVNGEAVVGIGVSIQTAFDSGFRIMSILPDSPALEAGLEAGDRIIAVNGTALTDGSDVRSLIAGEEGTSVTITVIRQADGSVWLYGVVMDARDAREDEKQPAAPQEQKRVTVQNFGYLNILIDGEPVVFEHEKAKELLAVLIDRQGKFVSSGEIISCLWEDESVNVNTQSRCRKAAYHLRRILAAYGLEDLLESTPKGYRRIRTEMIDCDLYHYLDGEEAYIKRFRGAYMSDYSWAEQTLTMLMYRK